MLSIVKSTSIIPGKPVLVFLFLVLLFPFSLAVADSSGINSPGFDDSPLKEPIHHPKWFKLSFLDIYDDIKEAVDGGKKGLVIYFGQERCPYCKALLENDFGKEDIVRYTRKYFDVIAIDVRGNNTVTDVDGEVYTEKKFAVAKGANFTPTLIFYDKHFKQVFKLVGYYPPYKFRAALEYVADGYYKKENFRTFLARGEMPPREDARELNHADFFMKPPYILDRSKIAAQRPLAVFLEQKDCYACDVLHTDPLSKETNRKMLGNMDVVQLDIWKNTPLITPKGEKITAKEWAKKLGIFYTPTIIFFDEKGNEVLRLDSVVHFYRLQNALNYILDKGYNKYKNYRAWREAKKH